MLVIRRDLTTLNYQRHEIQDSCPLYVIQISLVAISIRYSDLSFCLIFLAYTPAPS
jgi:hypothetical protein